MKRSLSFSGADKETINQIINEVRDDLYHGMPTQKIYDKSFELLRKKKSIYASKYKLKKSICELGPSGFPFEILVYYLFKDLGFEVSKNRILQGNCITHEIDVLVETENDLKAIECKFHSLETRNSNVKTPLYIESRFRDILANRAAEDKIFNFLILTNTRFTKDAVTYAECVGLDLMSWNYPKGKGLKEFLDKNRLYPITVSTLLTNEEVKLLLEKNVVLERQLVQNEKDLIEIGITKNRREKILEEARLLCLNRH